MGGSLEPWAAPLALAGGRPPGARGSTPRLATQEGIGPLSEPAGASAGEFWPGPHPCRGRSGAAASRARSRRRSGNGSTSLPSSRWAGRSPVHLGTPWPGGAGEADGSRRVEPGHARGSGPSRAVGRSSRGRRRRTPTAGRRPATSARRRRALRSDGPPCRPALGAPPTERRGPVPAHPSAHPAGSLTFDQARPVAPVDSAGDGQPQRRSPTTLWPARSAWTSDDRRSGARPGVDRASLGAVREGPDDPAARTSRAGSTFLSPGHTTLAQGVGVGRLMQHVALTPARGEKGPASAGRRVAGKQRSDGRGRTG